MDTASRLGTRSRKTRCIVAVSGTGTCRLHLPFGRRIILSWRQMSLARPDAGRSLPRAALIRGTAPAAENCQSASP